MFHFSVFTNAYNVLQSYSPPISFKLFILKRLWREEVHSNFTWFLLDTKFSHAARSQTFGGQTTEETWKHVPLARILM
jgi:hypothetical protein